MSFSLRPGTCEALIPISAAYAALAAAATAKPTHAKHGRWSPGGTNRALPAVDSGFLASYTAGEVAMARMASSLADMDVPAEHKLPTSLLQTAAGAAFHARFHAMLLSYAR
jgi:hypothetical protein